MHPDGTNILTDPHGQILVKEDHVSLVKIVYFNQFPSRNLGTKFFNLVRFYFVFSLTILLDLRLPPNVPGFGIMLSLPK